VALGCRSVAFTYNDPVIFMEYAVDVAQACHEVGVKAVAVTAGYIRPEPRVKFYRHMDAANVDLKGFTEDFYRRICAGRLQPVLETLEYHKHETRGVVRDHQPADPGRQRHRRRDRRHDRLGG
jgi:pyruvate formate lyase activating enzyme